MILSLLVKVVFDVKNAGIIFDYFFEVFSYSYQERIACSCQNTEELKKSFLYTFHRYSSSVEENMFIDSMLGIHSTNTLFEIKPLPILNKNKDRFSNRNILNDFFKMLAVVRKSYFSLLGKAGPDLFILFKKQ